MTGRLILAFALAAPAASASSRVDDALALEAKGNLAASRDVLRAALPELRKSGGRDLARALSIAGRIDVSLGAYPEAIRNASEAIAVRRRLQQDSTIIEDLNTLGLANLYLGNYDEALSNYQKALALDRSQHDGDGEVARENNIGNIFYFRGRYLDALRFYQQAMDKIDASAGEKWVPWRRQLTLANLATLYQRLGKEQTALDYYRQLTGAANAMPPDEYAQLLLNEGVLYRRMGDPVKALERYRESQALFAKAHHLDGEIGALRNTGIAQAIDFDDLGGALNAFTSALELARQSSDTRGVVQASLYRGEVLQRLHRMPAAQADYQTALEGAQKAGLPEEKWKALYGLGKIAEARGETQAASGFYEKSIAGIESMRAGLRLTSLRTEFLADKRDVYDSLIALALRQTPAPADAIFSWMERSRARTLQEQVQSGTPRAEPSIRAVQEHLSPETVLLDLWVGRDSSAILWIGKTGFGVVRRDGGAESLAGAASRLERCIADSDERWRVESKSLGTFLLQGVPRARHVVIAPDGVFSALPLELLTDPESGSLLIEQSDVSYVPAARFVTQPSSRGRNWLLPWRTQMLAFGDPPTGGEDPLAGGERWQPLPAAAEEIQGIAQILVGRSEVHLGAAARKRTLFHRPAEPPLIHFTTHAVVDTENPDRSRILMAGDSGGSVDYIFQQEVYGLNLHGVDLVTVSACDTARGKLVRGEGIQAFSRAFLAAGASATVTSLWRVADRPTADFMQQLYYYLASGQSKAEALRSAKLRFLHSNSQLNEPRHWAAFVLTGDGWDVCARVVPWSWVGTAAGSVLLLAGIVTVLVRKATATARR